MKRLIDTKQLKETLIREENELSKIFFESEKYPIGFLTGVEQSMSLANIAYVMSYDIDNAIETLFNRLDGINNECVKCGYYFVLSFLHYINDDLTLCLLASRCIQSCYRMGGC